MFRVDLPYPSKHLNPNRSSGRKWYSLAAAKKRARGAAITLTCEAKGRSKVTLSEGGIGVDITIHPPDRRKRDLDNAIASTKALQDGVALALGVDDSRFIPTYRWGEPVKGGRIVFAFPGAEVSG